MSNSKTIDDRLVERGVKKWETACEEAARPLIRFVNGDASVQWDEVDGLFEKGGAPYTFGRALSAILIALRAHKRGRDRYSDREREAFLSKLDQLQSDVDELRDQVSS